MCVEPSQSPLTRGQMSFTGSPYLVKNWFNPKKIRRHSCGSDIERKIGETFKTLTEFP